jgi:hypothetical protein
MKKICFETFLPGACDTKPFALVIVTAVKKAIGRYDTQHNDTQHKGLICDNQHK